MTQINLGKAKHTRLIRQTKASKPVCTWMEKELGKRKNPLLVEDSTSVRRQQNGVYLQRSLLYITTKLLES
jgi:hypothetical protein